MLDAELPEHRHLPHWKDQSKSRGWPLFNARATAWWPQMGQAESPYLGESCWWPYLEIISVSKSSHFPHRLSRFPPLLVAIVCARYPTVWFVGDYWLTLCSLIMSFPKVCEQFWGASQALCTAPHSRGHLPPWICDAAAYWVPLDTPPSAAPLQSRGKLDSQSQQRRWEVYSVGSWKQGRLLLRKKLPRLVKCSPTTCVGFRSKHFFLEIFLKHLQRSSAWRQ